MSMPATIPVPQACLVVLSGRQPVSGPSSRLVCRFSRHRAETRRQVIAATKNIEISVAADEGMQPLSQIWPVEEGSKLYTASLKKPLGLTLAEQGGMVVVETVTGNGEAADIRVGDIVRGTTARSKNVRQDTATSVEARNKQSFLGGLVLMRADGETFDTVLAAIQSSKCSACDVTLVLERPGQNFFLSIILANMVLASSRDFSAFSKKIGLPAVIANVVTEMRQVLPE